MKWTLGQGAHYDTGCRQCVVPAREETRVKTLAIRRPDDAPPLRVLHISMHQGCIEDINYVARRLKFNLTTLFYEDPGYGSRKYNMIRERVERTWNRLGSFFRQFDVIISSDTGALARLFLQDDRWVGDPARGLILWICNRFDYAVLNIKNDTEPAFPDEEFYALWRSAPAKPNVVIAGYTPFENEYARKYHAVDVGTAVVRPTGGGWTKSPGWKSGIPANVTDLANTFLVPPYENDRTANVTAQCARVGIKCYRGRYNGPEDLKQFKGIIHIPYAWSNLALFEMWQRGVVYMIPSLQFIMELVPGTRFWSPPWNTRLIRLSEWYHPDHEQLFVFFDSWEDMAVKARTADFDAVRRRAAAFGLARLETSLRQWATMLNIAFEA
jgi:hypothetical protein